MAQPPPPPPSAPWTAPPQPPPPAWSPPTPRPRRRRLWIYALIGAVGVIVGLAIASGTLWVTKVKPPVDAANDYLRDISNVEYKSAFDRLCPAERVDASPRSVERLDDELLIDEYEVSPFDVRLDGSRATVEVELDPDEDGQVVRLRLREIDGTWQPCGGRLGFIEGTRSD